MPQLISILVTFLISKLRQLQVTCSILNFRIWELWQCILAAQAVKHDGCVNINPMCRNKSWCLYCTSMETYEALISVIVKRHVNHKFESIADSIAVCELKFFKSKNVDHL